MNGSSGIVEGSIKAPKIVARGKQGVIKKGSINTVISDLKGRSATIYLESDDNHPIGHINRDGSCVFIPWY